MNQSECSISNLTSNTINLLLTDPISNTSSNLVLKSNETNNLKLYDVEYEVKFLKVNENPSSVTFKLRFSAFMAIMQEMFNNEFYFQDFLSNYKYKPTSQSNFQANQTQIPKTSTAFINNSQNQNNFNFSSKFPGTSNFTITSGTFKENTSSDFQPGNQFSQTSYHYSNNTSTPSISNLGGFTTNSFSTNFNVNNGIIDSINSQFKDFNIKSGNFPLNNPHLSDDFNTFITTIPNLNNPISQNTSFNYNDINQLINNPINITTSNTFNPNKHTTANIYNNEYSNPTGNQNYNFGLNSNINTNSFISNSAFQISTNPENFGMMKHDFNRPSNNSINLGYNIETQTKPITNVNYNNIGSTNPNNYDVFNTYIEPVNVEKTLTNLTSITPSKDPLKAEKSENNLLSLLSEKESFKVGIDTNNALSLKVIKNQNTKKEKKRIRKIFKDMKFEDIGKLIANNKIQFDVSFLCKKMLANKGSIFNQLHNRDYEGKEMKKNKTVAPNEIKIKNKAKIDMWFRVSGMDNIDDYIYPIESGEKYVWNKKPNSIYKVEITANKDLNGTTYNIKSGCSYIFNIKNILTDSGKNTLLSCSTNFNPIFELENQYGVIYERNDKSMHKFNQNTNLDIIIVNRSNDNINIKIEGDKAMSFEDIMEIEPLTYCIFKRKEGKYMSHFNKKGDHAYTGKSLLQSGFVYNFNDDNKGICNDISNEGIEKFFKNHSANQFSKFIFNNQEKKKKNNWTKIEEIIKNHPNKIKIKDFALLLFRYIEIVNNSSNDIYVRVLSKKIGSEQFIYIPAYGKQTWKRIDGTYLTEIVTNDMISKRYYLKTDFVYIYDSKDGLFNSQEQMTVNLVKDRFASKELIYFNASTREYLRKDIIYEEEHILGNIAHNQKIQNDEKYEYFDNIEPDYVPGTPFVDKNFPPNQMSLKALDPKTGIKKKSHFKHGEKALSQGTIDFIEWKRPKDAFEKQYYLFKDEICYDDVKQGSIGDCYLMSVLAALSQRPDLIQGAFKTQTVNPDGFYEIFFYEKGEKKIMFIDDHLILTKSKYLKNFEFAKPNGEELWVMLLEKAYAKYEGGFSNIIGGLMYQELKWITGAHTRELKVTDPQCWKEIHSSCRAGHIIVAASNKGSGDHSKKSEKGISNGHAYSILFASEYNESHGTSIKLLKMRNPWGHTEWKGDYSDNSSLWTPELKEFFNYKESTKEDGVFFIPFDDYVKEFKNVIICAIDSRSDIVDKEKLQ